MRVVHLPYNVASQIQIQVKALRGAGVETRGLVMNASSTQSSAGMEIYDAFPDEPRFSLRWVRDRIARSRSVLAAIKWADVVHYQYGNAFALPGRLDAAFAGGLKKLRLVTFWGTDIRVPEIECRENPYFAAIYPELHKRWGTRKSSYRVQEWYAKRGFHCVLGSESMLPHVDRSLFRDVHMVRGAVDSENLYPVYPEPERLKVVIAHAPSDQLVKGTAAVLSAISQLQRKRLDLEFILIHNTPREKALEIVQHADVFLDQFVLGAYGTAAIEAMALGKPVVCYIKPSLVREYPSDLPIVNASQEQLVSALEELILDGQLRRGLGIRGRQFVDKYHDSRMAGEQLKTLYHKLLAGMG